MIDTNDHDLLDCTDAGSEDETKPRHGSLLWPWLLLLSLLTIGVSAIGAMVVG
jgi:hypothetical protein